MKDFFLSAVDGQWSHWTYFPCSVSCGQGQRNCTRTCTNPPPSGGGKDCSGTAFETLHCYNPPCPGKLPRCLSIVFFIKEQKNDTAATFAWYMDVTQGDQYHKQYYVYLLVLNYLLLVKSLFAIHRFLCLYNHAQSALDYLSVCLSVSSLHLSICFLIDLS